jgi:hypothetical protein
MIPRVALALWCLPPLLMGTGFVLHTMSTEALMLIGVTLLCGSIAAAWGCVFIYLLDRVRLDN